MNISDVSLKNVYNEAMIAVKAAHKELIKVEKPGFEIPAEAYEELRNEYEVASKLSMDYLEEIFNRRSAAINVLRNSKDPEIIAAIKTLDILKI